VANELHFAWPSITPAHLGDSSDAGAKILANLLALPEQTYQDRVGTAQMRAVARSMGVPEEQLNTVMPGEDVPTPVGGTGIMGKIISGVGKTGATLSAILGAPVKPPRFGPTEIKDLEEGSAREALIGTLNKDDPDYAKKAAKIRLGKYDDVFPGAPKNIMQLAQTEADRQGLTGADRYNFIRDQVVQMTGAQTQARTDVASQAEIDKKNAEIDKQNETIREWNKNHPEAQRPETPHLTLDSSRGGAPGGPEGGTTQPGGAVGGFGNLPKPDDPVRPGYVSAYDPRYTEAETKWGVPIGLVRAVHEHESGFNVSIRNKSGGPDAGLGQFIPSTAQEYGVNPLDAGSSIDGTAHLLHDLYNRTGNWHDAVLGYNGGGDPKYPVNAILQRAGQYRQVLAGMKPGEQPTAPVQVAANVPRDTASDVGGAGAIGIPSDAVTDQQGNVYSRTDLTKPLGKVNPAKPGTMIKAKETLGPTGVTTEVVDPTAPFQADKQRNMAIAQLHQEQANGQPVDPNDERQIYDRMARNAQGLRGFTEADAAEAAVGHKPGEPWSADQARKVLEILKNKGGETGPQAALARITLQRADNALLMQPVQKTDPNTGQALKDQNGRPVYAMWTDPQDGIRKPIRPVDVAMTNWMVAHMPFAAQINMQQMTNDPDFHLAATMLNQAQSNLTRWATLKGDAKRIADTERVRMATMVPQPGDTKQQAIDKITLGNQALDRMEAQARKELALTDVIPQSPTAPTAPEAPPAAPTPRRKIKAPAGVSLEPMGQQ
jgi:hypothetical protein